MIAETPRGFKDVLPGEARWREHLATEVQKALSSWGYAPIETPTLEVLEVLEQGGKLSQASFRLFDLDGTLLVLRPDATLAVARMVASKLPKNKNFAENPLRLRYMHRIFREEESLRAQAREFTQIGVESIGIAGAYADAEVILLMADALKAAGLKEFRISICTVLVLSDLLTTIEKMFMVAPSWRNQVMSAFHHNDMVRIGELAKDADIDASYAKALESLIDIQGGIEAIARCRDLLAPLGLGGGLDQLEESYKIIAGAGYERFVSIDFSVMSAFDYYTGLVFEAYAPGLGQPLGSGGRYDNMLEAYGAKAPAAGFAFSLERVMMALVEQDSTVAADVLSPEVEQLSVGKERAVEDFVRAGKLRAEGKKVVMVYGGSSEVSK